MRYHRVKKSGDKDVAGSVTDCTVSSRRIGAHRDDTRWRMFLVQQRGMLITIEFPMSDILRYLDDALGEDLFGKPQASVSGRL